MHGSIPVLKLQKAPLPLFSKEGTMPPFKKGMTGGILQFNAITGMRFLI